MSKIDVVRAAMVQAMKAKDKARKDSLSIPVLNSWKIWMAPSWAIWFTPLMNCLRFMVSTWRTLAK